MGARQRFEIPQGWVARGFRLEVAATTAEQRELIRQQFGARRFAYNWALAQVKADLDARAVDPSVPALGWSLPALRKAWNQAKQRVAPWWPTCSKEACSSGIADLVAALHHWSDSKAGRRKGPRVGFPRFKARHRDRGRVRFTTGAMRLEADRRHLTLPVIGRLRSKENTRRLERLVVKGRARVLSMTLSEQGGRLVVSIATIVCHAPRTPAEPDARCGLDLGIGQEWAVIAHDDTIQRIAHPAPWVQTHSERRRVARQRSRRIVGSRGHRQASAKLAALDVAAMGRGMGRRAFRRSVAHAGIGMVRPTLAYKTAWAGGRLLLADRWSRRPRPTMAAMVTWPISGSASAYGRVRRVGRSWTATPTRPVTSVTGPDRSPSPSLATGMSSGVELPPRCRAWVTTAGRHTFCVGVRGSRRPPRVAGADDTRTKLQQQRGLEPRAGVPASERLQTLTRLVTDAGW